MEVWTKFFRGDSGLASVSISIPEKRDFNLVSRGGKFFVIDCIKFIGYGKEKFIVCKNLEISEIKRFCKSKIIVLDFSYFDEMHKGNEK